VNVYGYNHDWVNSTHRQLQDFFGRLAVKRTFLHGSGTYDFFLYCLYLPLILWLMYRIERQVPNIFSAESRVSIVAAYIYAIVISLFLGRILFQYVRWLFPPVEYENRLNWTPRIQRGIFLMLLLGALGTVLYDLTGWLLLR
jgi:hypothetical protein